MIQYVICYFDDKKIFANGQYIMVGNEPIYESGNFNRYPTHDDIVANEPPHYVYAKVEKRYFPKGRKPRG